MQFDLGKSEEATFIKRKMTDTINGNVERYNVIEVLEPAEILQNTL